MFCLEAKVRSATFRTARLGTPQLRRKEQENENTFHQVEAHNAKVADGIQPTESRTGQWF
jgi:hypothetical protein